MGCQNTDERGSGITSELILEEIISLSPPTLNEILHQRLKISKVCARWIPHRLTEDQKDRRVSWCKFMIQKFDNGKSKLLDHVVTGDETWIYQYDPESKKQSSVWRFPGEHNPTKVQRQKSAGKQMIATFFAKWGHVTTIPLVERKTVNSEWYSEVCIPKVTQEWHCKFKNVSEDKSYGIMIMQVHTLLQEHWTHLQIMIYNSSHTLHRIFS